MNAKNTHTTNYFDTLIEIADDCPITKSETPASKSDKPTIASMQYELISKHPYKWTSDDVIFQNYASKNELTASELSAAREVFFSKGQPCLRTSPLGKRYGFGIHSDKNGKIALYGIETEEYLQFLNDTSIVKVKAMRSSRK